MKYHILYLSLLLSGFSFGQTTPPPPPPDSYNGVNVYKVVEHQPEFPGGDEAMMKFIQKNIRYPDTERESDVQGRVVVQFVVNEDGSLSDIVVKKSVSPGIDKEAMRVVSMLPKFKPGTQQGKAVRVQFILPIMFKLATDLPKAKPK
jgi:protein TonB